MFRIDSPLIFTTFTYSMDEALRLVAAVGLLAGEFTITRV